MRTFAQTHQSQTLGSFGLARSNIPTHAEEPESKQTDGPSPRFRYDFSRITIHPPVARNIQTKLALNQPGDEYELEADHVSEQVMEMPAPSFQHVTGNSVAQGRDHEPLQLKRFRENDLGKIAAPPVVDEVLRSTGQPLDAATRNFMEPRFRYDFSRVRVHNGTIAEQSAREVNAHAYTAGNDIVFGEGRFAPETTDGRRLIAHELMHVVQQTGWPPVVRRSPADTESLNEQDAPTFGNLSGDEAKHHIKPRVLQTRNGKWYELNPGKEPRRATGLYDFVVRDGQMWAVKATKGGHVEAARGKRVVFAGSIRFDKHGALVQWNDGSGHFRPSPSFVGNINANLPSEAQLPVPSPEELSEALKPEAGSPASKAKFRRHPERKESGITQLPVFQSPNDEVLLPRGRGGDVKRLGSAVPQPIPQKTIAEGEFEAKAPADGAPSDATTEVGASGTSEGGGASGSSTGGSTKESVGSTAAGPATKTTDQVAKPNATKSKGATNAPATTAASPLTEQTVRAELDGLVEGRGRAVLGTIVRVGNRGFAAVKIAGTLYMIYSVTQIRSLADAGAFAGTWAESAILMKAAEKVLGGSSPVGWMLVIVVGMSSDQGAAYQEREAKNAAVMKFLNDHFTEQEINANFSTITREAEKLLFETKPFELERIPPTVSPLPSGTLHVDVSPPNYDGILVPMLKPRFDSNNVLAYGGRVAKVKAFFSQLHRDDAKRLEARLKARKPGDEVAKYFHDNLSTRTRNDLLSILADASF